MKILWWLPMILIILRWLLKILWWFQMVHGDSMIIHDNPDDPMMTPRWSMNIHDDSWWSYDDPWWSYDDPWWSFDDPWWLPDILWWSMMILWYSMIIPDDPMISMTIHDDPMMIVIWSYDLHDIHDDPMMILWFPWWLPDGPWWSYDNPLTYSISICLAQSVNLSPNAICGRITIFKKQRFVRTLPMQKPSCFWVRLGSG